MGHTHPDSHQELTNIVLISISRIADKPWLYYYLNGNYRTALLKNPEVLGNGLLTGTELNIRLFQGSEASSDVDEAELVLTDSDFLPKSFLDMLDSAPPAQSVFFGLISEPENNSGRYFMLRDINADGLLLCTGRYTVKKGLGYCSNFDGSWHLRYDIIENFFYGVERPVSEISSWKHPGIRLHRIDDELSYKDLTKRHRNYAAGWHRYNFFFTDDWSLGFYRRQARLGFIAITHTENGRARLTPQLQREYAVLDWKNLVIDRKIRKILDSDRLQGESIRLEISRDPAEVLSHLVLVWKETWITPEYENLIKNLAADVNARDDRRFRIWGVCLSAGPDHEIIAGELGYSIGRTYTSLTGFFHRDNRKYDNFGKLQMVMLANLLEKAGIRFWNLGQPYMEYKLKLGADVVPRGLFLERWDRAVRGRTPALERIAEAENKKREGNSPPP